ncbi:hypothetical protein [Nocardia veterana]|uniref:Uncharacterized protein n=1 Tax=Nocardia veterana TaxID=132249 RepID=A0A7X6RGS9_9NOCA|nr:hypothetical protein [Nocardia veterana]NKY85447.1 hypothetical protein [Nocardia veterana]
MSDKREAARCADRVRVFRTASSTVSDNRGAARYARRMSSSRPEAR